MADSGHPPAELHERLLICRTIKLNAGAHGGHRRCCHAQMQKNAQNKPQIARLILCVHTTLQVYCNLFLTFCKAAPIIELHTKELVVLLNFFIPHPEETVKEDYIMANIKVTSKQDAWNKVNQIFPTDYEQDVQSSTRAGYPVYRSTAEGHYYDYICDLGDRLEVNLDSSHLETANIWIEEPATEEAPVLSEERVAVAKRLQRAVFYFTEEYLKELENKAKEDEAVAAMQANSSKDGPVQCMVLTAEGNANVMLDCIKELHRAVHILLDKQEDVDEWMLSGITAMMDRANEMKIIPYDLPTSICGLLCAQYR